MKFHKLFILSFLLILSLSNVVGVLDSTDKAYLDAQTTKQTAQINSKIDGVQTSLYNNMQSEFEASTRWLKDELNKVIKTGVKVIVIGMGGIMIVILALFKILDYNISQTKHIKRYEEQLTKQIKNNEKYKMDLIVYKNSLLMYHKKVMNGLGQTIPNPINQPIEEKKLPFFKKKTFWIFVLFAGIILIFIAFLIMFIIYKIKTPVTLSNITQINMT